jgi:spore coat protein U domain-containing protein, fimbrial subunit CupE1/2/3/6
MRVQGLPGIAGLALAALLALPMAAMGQCSFVSVTGVNFGAYDVFNNSPTGSTGTITSSCTLALTITMDLSKGNASTYATWQMRQGGSFTLNYNRFTEATRNTIWGDGPDGSSRYGPIIPTPFTQMTLTVYDRIPARQNARVGSYTDTITATINF